MVWNDWKKNLAMVLVGSMFAFVVVRFVIASNQRTQDILLRQEAERVERFHNATIERDKLMTEILAVKVAMQERTSDRYTNTDATRDLKRLSGRLDALSRDLYSGLATRPTTQP